MCFCLLVPVGMEVDAVLDSGSEGEFSEKIFICHILKVCHSCLTDVCECNEDRSCCHWRPVLAVCLKIHVCLR